MRDEGGGREEMRQDKGKRQRTERKGMKEEMGGGRKGR